MTIEKATIVADVYRALAKDDKTDAARMLRAEYAFEPVSRLVSGVSQ